MRWRESVIIIHAMPHGERHVVAEVFAARRGRWRGLVHGGRTPARRALLQPGNIASAEWSARAETMLGTLRLETERQVAALALGDGVLLAVIESLATELRLCPERAPFPRLFRGARALLENVGEPLVAAALLARFELTLLAELGYGLDLSACALTGQQDDLAWVSPRSGRAATRAAGQPWADRLLPLPAFLLGRDGAPRAEEVRDALRLCGHFLQSRLFVPRGLSFPAVRQSLVDMVSELGKNS